MDDFEYFTPEALKQMAEQAVGIPVTIDGKEIGKVMKFEVSKEWLMKQEDLYEAECCNAGAPMSVLDFYVKESKHFQDKCKQLEQAAKWLRIWTSYGVICGLVKPNRIQRANMKASYAASRLFNLIEE